MEDVLIIGAGPAGCSVAIAALENGFAGRITIADALRRNNTWDPTLPAGAHSMCSGGLGLHMLDMIQGTDRAWRIPESIIMTRIHRAVIRGPSSRVEIDAGLLGRPDEPIGIVMNRKKLDDWLLSRAIKLGAEYRPGFRARVIATHNGGWCANTNATGEETPETHAYGDFLIGADGPESLVAKTGFGAPDIRDHDMFLATEVYLNIGTAFPTDCIEVAFDTSRCKGYFWNFSAGGPGNVVKCGVGTSREHGMNPANLLAEWRAQKEVETGSPAWMTGKVLEHVGGRITGAPPLPRVMDSRHGIAVVGEAARAVWASIGAGDASAIQSGKILGAALAAGRPEEYQKWWRKDHYGLLRRHYRVKEALLGLRNSQIDRGINAIASYHPKSTNTRREVPKLMWHLLRREPWLLGGAALKALRP